MAWVQQDRMRNVNLPRQGVMKTMNGTSSVDLQVPLLLESIEKLTLSKTLELGDEFSRDPVIDLSVILYLEELILHTFLPRKTPMEFQNNLDEIEDSMLHLANATLKNLNIPQLAKVEQMLENWQTIQVQSSTTLPEFVKAFSTTMRKLRIDESAVIYVRQQNCNILFTKLEGNMMRCMTYRSSLPNETIMSTIGSLQATFPETDDVTLNQDILCSVSFALQLFELCTKKFEMTMPKRVKAGSQYVENRDVAEPFLVSDWIVGQLVPGNHPLSSVTVTKKIRDEVRCQPSASAIPFRRSGMWTSIKIAIALKIKGILKSEENANLLYKVVMLRLLANLGLYYSQQHQVRVDLASQILAKLGRRACKLQNLKADQNEEFNKSISSVKDEVLQHVLQVSTALHKKTIKLWNKVTLSTNEASVKRIFLSPDQIQEDLQHVISFLDEIIRIRELSPPALDQNGITNIQLVHLQRYTTFEACLQASIPSNDFERKVWLHDTELLIKTRLHLIEDQVQNLMKTFNKYISIASSFYKSQADPVGFSQMLLCILKLIQALDKIATRQYPLLREYQSGIHEKDFDMLLLPQVDDMTLLEETLAYFRIRDRNAKYPSTLNSPAVDGRTFSVRYAMTNPSMMMLRTSILEETERRTLAKHAEVVRAKERCAEIERQISNEGGCSCKYALDDYGHRSYKISTCQYCKLKTTLGSEKQCVSLYERPLPAEEHLQHAVIFELQVPEELSSLRDAIALLTFDILETSVFNGYQPSTRWENYLSRNPPRCGSMLVKLWSNPKPASETNMRRSNNPDVRYSSKEDFVVYNGMDCVYFHNASGADLTKANAKESCTFQIRNTSSPGMNMYQNLQYSVNYTNHTQNKIIASSYSCHRDLTVAEFISFGSLRSGHRVQIRNLFRSISNRTLSLEKEPVVALILQTLWQLGQMDKDGVRESHAEFLENYDFTKEFLVLLENVVDNNEQNYSSPYILLVVIVAIVRLMELNENCRQEGYQLLHKCRQLLNKWAERIEKYISDEMIKSSSLNLKSLKLRLIEIIICSVFTYKISSSLLDTVAQQADDIMHWFHTVSRMHELISEKVGNHLSTFTKSLLMNCRAVAFQLENGELFSDTSEMSDCLHSFATQKWNKANGCILQGSWRKHRTHPNVFVAKYMEKDSRAEHTLTFDVHQGSFLVDGYPSSSLPPQITDNSLYQLFFSGIKFKIQRDSQTFRTVDPFHGKHYEFILTSPNNKSTAELIIREIDNEQNTLELVRPSNFEGIIAPSFIGKYTHWLDAKKKIVYFKQRSSEDSHYDLPPDFTLTKVDSYWIFKNLKTKTCIFSINSQGFDKLSKALSRLEERPDINLVLNEATQHETRQQVSALLPRYQLSFNLNNDGFLCSVEYHDFKISEVQVLGTLVGLQQGILMENQIKGKNGTAIKKQLVLIPHGQIEITPGVLHQTTRIKLSALRSPKFFAYEVDSILNRLVGGKSKPAWLYLAALHAATSSSLPDPFTGLTGTEMSMWILQSAMVWSGSPYDDESLETLATIRRFSPERSYYGINPRRLDIEVLSWPRGLNELAAFDGFEIIVERLLRDSGQLSFLFPRSRKLEEALDPRKDRQEGKEQLRIRSYLRNLPFYNQDVSVKEDFICKSYKSHIGSGQKIPSFLSRRENNCEQLVSISQIRFVKDNIIHPSTLNFLQMCHLRSYLISSQSLSPPTEIKSVVGLSLESLFKTDMRVGWLSLYEYARSGKSKTIHEDYLAWSVYLSGMAYMGHPMEQIVALHLISLFADIIQFPKVPEYTEPTTYGHSKLACGYSSPSTNAYSRQEIKSILDSNEIEFRDRRKKVRINPKTGYYEDEDYDDYQRELRSYNLIQKNDFESIVTTVASQWPCDKVEHVSMFSGSNCNYREALELVNKKLNFWYNNYKLKLFVEEVEHMVKSGLYQLVSQKLETPSTLSVDSFGVFEQKMTIASVSIDTKKVLELEEFLKGLSSGNELTLRTAKTVFESGKIETLSHLSLEEQHETVLSAVEKHFEIISKQMTYVIEKEIPFITGIAPRATPLFLTQLLTNEKIKKNPVVYNFIGALVVHYATLKKIRRCIRFKSKENLENTFAIELKRELENELHENWSPAENPEWLLLELELDLMIRPVQVEVARQMMKMPNGGNGVMQLNMGEGKTSVIVPMLCATLANEKTLCRVTVLNSIFKTNFNILAFAIGGLLNRRLCTVPCRRDMSIKVADIQRIAKLYKQCLRMKGVILTLPEYRLSFRLKIFDSIIKKEEALGLELLDVENWLRDHARDILDESDELLSVKYQLVYTIGTQVPVDGGSMRWTICQDLLRIIQQIAANLSAKHGSSVIEFENEIKRKHPEQFAHFRILKESCQDELCNAVTDILLKEMMLPETLKQIVRRFLTEESIPREVHNELMVSFEDTPDLLTKILLYSGYIRRGVLTLALTKRWRVEYGVDPNGRRRMAIPFRAKDVAAERTEFGHPDLAIVLTHLSYYYSGLSDPQLLECFECLEKKIDPEIIYRSWIQPIADNVPKFLLNYRGLNINDLVQRAMVFDVLRKHKAVIDFWLDHKVFPRESKQFPGKIVMTAWDLCYERNKYSTTGFSGTNDSSVLLPLPISQQDLPQLLLTNETLEKVLLQPENATVKGLRMGATCKEILGEMTKDGLRVLIDAGALMLECNNEQVAQLWLDVDPLIEAAVYFNKDNEIMVKTRVEIQKSNGPRRKQKDIPLELSPFGGRLGQCGVFLDDQHTRATDLKFPVGSKACVTVGTRMRRDKLMQACMRMRKLGQGHSVSFYLSHEAFDKVIEQQMMKPHTILGEQSEDIEMGYVVVLPKQTEPIQPQPETDDVINWVTSNTKQFNEDGLPYWAVAGKNYVQKLSAEDLFPLQKHIQRAPIILASQCEDEEVTMLKDLYGIYTRNELLVELIPRWFAQTKEKLRRHNSSIPIAPQIRSNIDSTCSSVVSRCEENAPEKMHLACLVDEEQEKELEKEAEIEEEREVNRPEKADEVQPSLHPNVLNVVYHGLEIDVIPGIQKLSGVFNNTSFNNEVQPGCWGNQVFATDDFISVIKIYNARFKTDSHLRPVEYLTIRENPGPGDPQILLLSPFEVNAFMPDFRKGRTTLRLHMFTPRTFEKQDLLLNNSRLQLPHARRTRATISLSEESKTMAALSLASGNLYFDSMEEQKAFARFLGLVPKPWADVEPRAFEEGKITKTGFLLPQFRESMWEHCKVEASTFSRDPITLVKKILSSRHAVVGEVAHVMKLLDKNLYVEVN